ncbi:ankyrin repeat and BTB/POZ domain-containing protein 1-like [Clytia hemisphaerica]|uniref:BTB domain-containing protein n=1 Tax=Clytia hemisphaerica TaxID=252671 RepID=A0A7M6DQ46_9CNID
MSTKNITKLFDFCRTGNLFDLKNIVEAEEVDVNVRDKWDSTPLYYACLCGHEKLVEYLLQKGAKCAANTFDGERCLYSALTQNIKKMLKDYKAISKDCIRRNAYVEFFKRCLSEHTYKDVCFTVHGVNFFAHRLVLSVRSPYFAHMFTTKWKERNNIRINNQKVTTKAFELLIQYIYTDRMEIPVEELDDIKILLKQCYLFQAAEKVERMEKEFNFYSATKPTSSSNNISILSFQPTLHSTELNESYSSITQLGIPYHLCSSQYWTSFPDIFFMELPEWLTIDKKAHDLRRLRESEAPLYSDVCFQINVHRFYGHKLFFCGRSEYFKALFHFQDVSTTSTRHHVIALNDIQPEVFTIIYTFVYTDTAVIPDELIGEVLHFACMYILPTLKTFCLKLMKGKLDTFNICETLRAARLYEMPALEQHCAAFMAMHLDEIIDDPDFVDLLRRDVMSIRDRQEIDSVPLADDINFHLFKGILPMSMDCDLVELKLEMLENLVNRLQQE